MKEKEINYKRPIISLQSVSNRGLKNFRAVLKREITEFENSQRKNDPYFDVYEWLGEHLGYGPGTIRKWLNENDQTGTKIGLEDLKFICLLLNTTRPADAFNYDIHSLFENRVYLVGTNYIKSIEKAGLKASSYIGLLCKDIDSAFEDGLFEPHEKDNLLEDISKSINHLKELEEKVKESK